MKTIAIAGCGKLGNIVADAILNGILPEYELTGVGYGDGHDEYAKVEALRDIKNHRISAIVKYSW